MNIKILIIFLFIFENNFLIAQKNLGITIRPIYGIGFSQIYIQNFEKLKPIDGYSNLLYDTEKPHIPIWSKRHGFELEVNISKKFLIGVGYIQSNRTTRTRLLHHIKGIEDAQQPPLFDGAQLVFDYRSTEYPLFFKYRLSKKRFSSYLQFSVIGDLYQYFKVTQKYKRKDRDVLQTATTTVWYHFNHGLLKIGVSPSYGINYKINRFLNVNCDLAYTYFTNSIRIDKCPFCPIFVAGNIHTLIPNLGIGFTL